MQGVEILNKEPVMTLTNTGEVIFKIVGIIAVMSIFCALGFFIEENGIGLIISGILVFISVAGMFINVKYNNEPTGTYSYEAVINDDVSSIVLWL